MTVNITSYSADTCIRGTLDCFKSLNADNSPYSYEVKFSRQQLAAITGLRLETVIRSLKKFEKDGLLKIIKGTVFY